MDNNEKYLPVGSVVKLKNSNKMVLIVGICSSPADNPNVIYDYSCCTYPEGVLSSKKFGLFNHDQIEEVCFKGFVNEEQIEFDKKMKDLRRIKENVVIYDENNEAPENVSFKTANPIQQPSEPEVPATKIVIKGLDTLQQTNEPEPGQRIIIKGLDTLQQSGETSPKSEVAMSDLESTTQINEPIPNGRIIIKGLDTTEN